MSLKLDQNGNAVFGDGRNIERELAEEIIATVSWEDVLLDNRLEPVDILEVLIRHGLIDTSYWEKPLTVYD